MSQQGGSIRASWNRVVLLILTVFALAGFADAQNLAFQPGVSSAYAGDPTQTNATSVSGASFTGVPTSLVLGRQPGSVAFDAAGNFYIMDAGNSIVRVVAASNNPIPTLPGVTVQAGHVYTVAGTTNQPGTSPPCSATGADVYGNGCPATVASVSGPFLAVDGNSNVYVAANYGSQVRVVYGGKGTLQGISNPQQGYIYALTNASNSDSQTDGTSGPAVNAVTPNITAMTTDTYGNVYIFDGGSYELLLVYQGGNLPPGFFNGATPVPGNIYLLTDDEHSCTDTTNLCNGQPIAQVYYNGIGMMSTDASGNLYIDDNEDSEIRAVYVAGTLNGVTDPVPGNIYAVAGNGSNGPPVNGSQATASSLSLPYQGGGIAVDSIGELYFTGSLSGGSEGIYKVDTSGVLTTVFGGSAPCTTATDPLNDGCIATAVNTAAFYGLVVDSTGNLYGSDYNFGPSVILKSTVSTTTIDYSGTIGLSSQSQTIAVANTGTQALQFSNLAFTGPFNQVLTGSNDCSNSTSLASGESCQIGVSFLPTAAGTVAGTITISSNALDATNGSNVVVLNGVAAQASSTTYLAISPSAPAVANVGQQVTFSATVEPLIGDSLIPSGTVAFMNGATQLGTGTITNGVATFTTSSLAAGTYPVTAVYSGDANFLTSTSTPVGLTVSTTPAAIITLTSSATTANSGQSVTLTATAAAFSGTGVPTGTITFQDGGNLLPNSTVTLSGGTAVLNTTALPPGNNELIAVYNGDSNFAANASADLLVNVTASGQLQFTPGVISLVTGSYFTPTNTSGGVIATDSYDNVYFIATNGALAYNGQLDVIASGNGAIPGVTNPVSGTLYTIGTGTACPGTPAAPCGDGGPVAQASFASLSYLAVDALNNIYVVDKGVIRKISAATGTINTVAGVWGTTAYPDTGYSGDNGPATSAQISVAGLFVDQNGNIYFADNADVLVRRVDGQSGIITTVAGTTAGAGTSTNRGPANECVAVPCGDGGLATSATFTEPIGVFVDPANNIYIVDSGFIDQSDIVGNINVVRRVDAKTGVISLFAGQYETQGPYGLAPPTCSPAAGPCGDGGPATSAVFDALTSISGDHAGNIYVTDSNVVREINIQTGIINTVIGNAANEGAGASGQCATAPCGDGGPATSAFLKTPRQIVLDAQGNMYVSDTGTDVIREVTVAQGALSYGSENLGTTNPQTLTLTNIGTLPLTFNALSIPEPNYEQQPSGGTDCTASTVLAPGTTCQLDIAFFPTATGSLPGNATIASDSTNATSGLNTVTLTGTGVSLGGSTAQAITFQPIPAGLSYGSQAILLSATSDSGLPITYEATGPAIVSGSTLTITGAGAVTVTAYQFGNSGYAPATPVSQSFTVAPATLTVAATNVSLTAGTALPAPAYTISGFVNNDTQTTTTTGAPSLTVVDSSGKTWSVGSTLLNGTYTITVQQGNLVLNAAAAANYKFVLENGTLTVTGTTAQTITFAPLNEVTYGASAIQLAATASSGLPISYTVQGPATVLANLLTITGAGPVAVTASQSGDSQYTAATPVTQAFNVDKAALNVVAVSASVAQGAPLPALTYTITGFVNGDSQAVVSGNPILTTTATSGSPVGQYPITVSVGTLTAANYTFNPVVGGTLNIVTPQTQTISFPAIANATYGAAPITLTATSSSGLAVSYAVTGPAMLSGNILTITGIGPVAVTASQAGNSVYGPASSVTQSFSVIPAVLTVTANNATRADNLPNPAFTYTIIGFVNGDTQQVAISGTPALTTTATLTSPVGQYPITPAIGGLNSPNYTFAFVSGILTVTAGGPVPDFSLTASPQTLLVAQGQIAQTTITMVPVNNYQGLVSLSCGTLPANVTCTFTPTSLSSNGMNAPVTTTLTVNTNSASPVVGQIQPRGKTPVVEAALWWLPAGVMGLFLAFRRKRFSKYLRMQQWLMLLTLLVGAAGLTACGGGTSTSGGTVASPGNSTFTVTATDSSSSSTHAINISLTVQ